MSTVSAEIKIAAPNEKVWEIVMDPSRLADWVTIHKSVSNASTPPLRKGATMDQSLQVRGLSFRVHWTLSAVDAPRAAQWEGDGPARSHALTRYELSEDENGDTIFRYTNEFQPPGGRLGNMAGKKIVGATSEREAHRSLSRLKELAEN